MLGNKLYTMSLIKIAKKEAEQVQILEIVAFLTLIMLLTRRCMLTD